VLFQKNADGWNILVASPLPRCLVFRFVTGLVFIKFLCFAEFADIDVVLPFAVLRGIHLSINHCVSRDVEFNYFQPLLWSYRLSFASISIHLYALAFGAFFEITNSPTRPCHLSPYRPPLNFEFSVLDFHHLQLSAHCQHVSRFCRRGVAESPSDPF
jgi:hypothetical protein